MSSPPDMSPPDGTEIPGGTFRFAGVVTVPPLLSNNSPEIPASFSLKLETISRTKTRIKVMVACIGTVRKEKVEAVN